MQYDCGQKVTERTRRRGKWLGGDGGQIIGSCMMVSMCTKYPRMARIAGLYDLGEFTRRPFT